MIEMLDLVRRSGVYMADLAKDGDPAVALLSREIQECLATGGWQLPSTPPPTHFGIITQRVYVLSLSRGMDFGWMNGGKWFFGGGESECKDVVAWMTLAQLPPRAMLPQFYEKVHEKDELRCTDKRWTDER